MADSQLGNKIRKLRKDLGLSQQQLGLQVGLDRGSIYKWEKGIGTPNAVQLQLLCKALACSADELLELSDPDQFESSGGLKWYIRRPRYGRPRNVKDLTTSIEVFLRALSTRQINDIQREPEFSHLNNSAVKQLLRLALLSRAVELVDVPRHDGLETRLKEKYGLRHCLVAKLDGLASNPILNTTIRKEAVAFLAAQHCVDLISHVSSIGFSGGAPIYRFVELLRPALPELTGKEYWSLLNTKRQRSIATWGTAANSVVTRMLRNQPGANGNLMPYLNPMRRTNEHFQASSGVEREELEHARFVKRMAAMVEVAFVTVGTPKADHLDRQAQKAIPEMGQVLNDQLAPEEMSSCVGDVLLRLLDKDGNRVGSERAQAANDEFVYSIELDDLRGICKREMVWVLAASPEKAPVIRALIASGMANCLVIDNTIAEALLRR